MAEPLVGEFHGEASSTPWASDDAACSTRNVQHPASEETETADKRTLEAEVSRFVDHQGDINDAAPELSQNAAEREDRSQLATVPTTLLASVEEGAREIGSVRGADKDLEAQGDRARTDILPTQKPGAVAAAFSAHLRGVDKYPLELARLCRFAQFLTENELLREAYEVSFYCGRGCTPPADCTTALSARETAA